MRRTLLILLACAIVIGAALWVALLPGAVRFEAGSLSIDAATPTLIFAALLILTLFYLVVRGLGGLLRLPHRVRTGRAARRQRAGEIAITRTLLALAAAQQSDALTESGRARRLLGDTPQTLLLAAQAHRLAGRDEPADALYTMLAERSDSALIGLRGLLEQALAQRDWTRAHGLATRADRAYPNCVWLREARATLAAQAGDGAIALSRAAPAAPRLTG